MKYQNITDIPSDSDDVLSTSSSMGSPQMLSVDDCQSPRDQHVDSHIDDETHDADSESNTRCEPSLVFPCGRDPEDMVQKYNDIFASYAEKSNAKSGLSATEGIRDLVGSLSALVLSEVSKYQGKPKKIRDRILKDQGHTLDRLVTVQQRSQVIAGKTFEFYGNPTPRLFVILPKGTEPLDRTDISRNEFQLFFLCECDRDIGSGTTNYIHFAKHEGYDLSQLSEDFFTAYGGYLVAMLELVKYGVVTEKMMVAPLSTYKVLEDGTNHLDRDSLQRKLVDTISYIKEQMGHGQESDDAAILNASESTDFGSLSSFISGPDQRPTLGSLYRTVTPDGHVKWVCWDHYSQKFGAASTESLRRVLDENHGSFEEQNGKIVVACSYLATAVQLSNELQLTRGIHELEFTLGWDASKNDLQEVCGALGKTNLAILKLDGSALVYVEPPAPPPPPEAPPAKEPAEGEDPPPPVEAPPPPPPVIQDRFSSIVDLLGCLRLQEFAVNGCSWFIQEINDPGSSPIESLRNLRLGIKSINDASNERFLQLLRRFPNLIHLTLYCEDWMDVYGLVHSHIKSLSQLETLTLSIPGQDHETVVLSVKSQTARCNTPWCHHVKTVIKHREDLATVLVNLQLGELASQIDSLDSTYGGQEDLKVVFAENGRNTVEVELRDPNRSYTDTTPSGQHIRGKRSDIYVRWIDHSALGLSAQTLSRADPLIGSSTKLDLNQVYNLMESLTNETRNSVEIVCGQQPHDMLRLAVSGMVTISWSDLSSLSLELCEDADRWIEELSRAFTKDGTPSLQTLKVYAGPSKDAFKGLSSQSAQWIISMVSKELERLMLRGIGLEDQKWDELVGAINFSKLKFLDMARSSIKREPVEKMLKAIPENSPLGELKLYGVEWVRAFTKSDQEKFIADNCVASKPYIVF
ncbi:hypothetical protein B0O80DRAFT_497860 [Mortierella sp. GBAus27b]|nr:hypothetical protein B0O80DRAFT_497860 [Mortierella sp. GBAus27b]